MSRSKIAIIIRREFNEKVRKKSFIISTILVPLLMAAAIGVMVYLQTASIGDAKRVLVSDASGIVAGALEGNSKLVFEPTTMTLEEFGRERPDVFGLLAVGSDIVENPSHMQLYTYKAATVELESTIAEQVSSIVEHERLKRYDIDNLAEIMEQIKAEASVQSYEISEEGDTSESSSGLSMIMAMFGGFLMFMFVTMYGGMVMQGVIEEKSNKVLEVMVSSVKPFELMMGKILGVALVAVVQFLIWIVLIGVFSTVIMQTFMGDMMEAAQNMSAMTTGMEMKMAGLGDMDSSTLAVVSKLTDPAYMGGILLSFLVFFLGGYLLYAAIFAAIGSAVDNVQDTQQLQTPVTVLLMVSYIVLFSVMKDPYSPVAVWCSMIPFTSPIIMLARVPYGVPLWQVVTSAAVLYASFVAMVWFAGKVYRVGIFMYGKKPTFKELIKWARYH